MYDDTNMKVKRDFTGLLNSLLASMCAKSMFGEGAALAFTEISVMQSFKYNLGGTGAMNLSIGKRNWRRTSFIPSMVNLGNELSSKYSDWQCTDEYRCSGKKNFMKIPASRYVLSGFIHVNTHSCDLLGSNCRE